MTNLTTHVLDTSKGKPASGMKLKLYKVTDKKLYNYDTEEVFFVGEEGYILYPFGSCT